MINVILIDWLLDLEFAEAGTGFTYVLCWLLYEWMVSKILYGDLTVLVKIGAECLPANLWQITRRTCSLKSVFSLFPDHEIIWRWNNWHIWYIRFETCRIFVKWNSQIKRKLSPPKSDPIHRRYQSVMTSIQFGMGRACSQNAGR